MLFSAVFCMPEFPFWTHGQGGHSSRCLGDIALCVYSYCIMSDGSIGVYDECDGWDPVRGMPPPSVWNKLTHENGVQNRSFVFVRCSGLGCLLAQLGWTRPYKNPKPKLPTTFLKTVVYLSSCRKTMFPQQNHSLISHWRSSLSLLLTISAIRQRKVLNPTRYSREILYFLFLRDLRMTKLIDGPGILRTHHILCAPGPLLGSRIHSNVIAP